MNTALSLSFLLMSTESNFLRSGSRLMVSILKLGTAARGLPCMVIVFSSVNGFIFYSSARSNR